MSNTQSKERANVKFLALDPYLETNIISPTEKRVPGKDFIEWGTINLYPEYLSDLYNNVATLKSVIDGCVDYIAGDDVTIIPLRPGMDDGVMNSRGDTIVEQVKNISHDEEKIGGFALSQRKYYGRGDGVGLSYERKPHRSDVGIDSSISSDLT